MRKDKDKLPLRLAYCSMKPIFYHEKPKDQIAKGPIAEIFNTVYPRYFNISFEVSKEGCTLGNRSPNGSYNGVIGMVQRGEADTMVMIATTDLEGEPVKFSPVGGVATGQIMTKLMRDDGVAYTPDLIDSFEAFDVNIWTSTVMAYVMVVMIYFGVVRNHPELKNSKLLDIVWLPLQVLLDQHDINVTLDQLKALFVCFCYAMFILQEVFRNMLSTDLVIVKRVDNINSMEDLVVAKDERPMQPMFLDSYPIMSKFEFAKKGSIEEKVWNLKPRVNRSHILSGGPAKFFEFVDAMSEDKVAFISHSLLVEPMLKFHCAKLNPDELEKRTCSSINKLKRHISKEPFLGTGYTMGVSRNIRWDVEDLYAKSLYNVYEAGIVDFWMTLIPERLMMFVASKLMGIQVDSMLICARCLELPETEPPPPELAVSLTNIRHFSKLLSAMVQFAMVCLVLEWITKKIQERKRSRRKRLKRLSLKRKKIKFRETVFIPEPAGRQHRTCSNWF